MDLYKRAEQTPKEFIYILDEKTCQLFCLTNDGLHTILDYYLVVNFLKQGVADFNLEKEYVGDLCLYIPLVARQTGYDIIHSKTLKYMDKLPKLFSGKVKISHITDAKRRYKDKYETNSKGSI